MVARMVIRIGAGDAGGAAAAGQDGGEPVRAGQGEAAARVISFIYYIILYYIILYYVVVKRAANLCELAIVLYCHQDGDRISELISESLSKSRIRVHFAQRLGW